MDRVNGAINHEIKSRWSPEELLEWLEERLHS